jgi:hypothetical protein
VDQFPAAELDQFRTGANLTTTNQTIKAATMSSITVRILAAVRRSLAAPRACQSRHRTSASTSGITAV